MMFRSECNPQEHQQLPATRTQEDLNIMEQGNASGLSFYSGFLIKVTAFFLIIC